MDTGQLLAIATAIDPRVRERTLEHWRSEGLLPRPERTGQDGLRPVMTYPPYTAEQLRTLLRLRQSTRDLNVLRVGLWFNGYPISPSLVRTSISAVLRKIKTDVERELAKRTPDVADEDEARWQAITDLAQVMAGLRARPLPRFGRQPLDERRRASALALGLALGEERASAQLDSDADALERLLGTDRGRTFRLTGVQPWLSGPAADGLALFSQFGNINTLIDAIESADDSEVEAAGAKARTFLAGLSFFARMADALLNRENATGMTAVAEVAKTPEVAILTSALLVSLGRSPDFAQGIDSLLKALTDSIPMQKEVLALASMSEEERLKILKNLPQLPYAQQAAIKRVIAEFQKRER